MDESHLGPIITLKHTGADYIVKDAFAAVAYSRLIPQYIEAGCVDVSSMDEADVDTLCRFLNGEEYEKSARMIAVGVEWGAARLIEECSVGREMEGLDALESIASVSSVVESRIWKLIVSGGDIGATKSVVVARRILERGLGSGYGSHSDGSRFIVSQASFLGVDSTSALIECLDLAAVDDACLNDLVRFSNGLAHEACRGEQSRRRLAQQISHLESLLIEKSNEMRTSIESIGERLDRSYAEIGDRFDRLENNVQMIRAAVTNDCELIANSISARADSMQADIRHLMADTVRKNTLEQMNDEMKTIRRLASAKEEVKQLMVGVMESKKMTEAISSRGCFTREFDGSKSGMMRGIIDGIQHASGKLVSESGICTLIGTTTGAGNQVDILTNYNQDGPWVSTESPSSSFEIDFKDARVQLTGYAIRTNVGGTGGPHLRSWVLEGTVEDQWIVFETMNNDESLNKGSEQHYFPLAQKTQSFKGIRLRQTGPNHKGHNLLYLHCFELFGTAENLPLRDCQQSLAKTDHLMSCLCKRVLRVEPANDPLDGLFGRIERYTGQGADEIGLVSLSALGTLMFQLSNIIRPDSSHWSSTVAQGSHFEIRFLKSCTMEITAYAIRTNSNGTDGPHLKSWIVEGLADGQWIALDTHQNDASLNAYAQIRLFTLQSPSIHVRAVRVRQTGPNWAGNNSIFIIRFDLFGRFHL